MKIMKVASIVTILAICILSLTGCGSQSSKVKVIDIPLTEEEYASV